MGKNTVIYLDEPVKNGKGDEAWSEISLSEPLLIHVQQFYDEQAKNGSLPAMGLLIHLVSGVPRDVINRLPFTEYRRAEAFMLGFLTYSPTDGGSS